MGGLEFSRNQKLALIAIVGLIAIGVSVKLAKDRSVALGGVTVREARAGDGVSVTASDSDSTHPNDANARTVTFQVVGCVSNPGVYTLPKGSRIIDAIKAAGGTKIGADTSSLNLAAKIEDASRIVIPSAQPLVAPAPAATPLTTTTAATAPAPAAPDHVKINIIPSGSRSRSGSRSSSSSKLKSPGEGSVNINTADASELTRLPGVGPSTAQKIIEYRQQVGRFSSVDQLDDVKGIGPKKLDKMRPFVTL